MESEDLPNDAVPDLLGGNIYVEGFDPSEEDLAPNEGDDHDPAGEWERGIDDWAREQGNVPTSSPHGSWNTIPFGTDGPCQERLFVDIREEHDIVSRFHATRDLLKACPKIYTVVFHIGGSIGYLCWVNALRFFLPQLKEIAPTAKFVTRIAWSWTPRDDQRPQKWAGCIHLGATDNGRNIPLRTINRVVFKHRVWLLEELGLLSEQCGYIEGFNLQPRPENAGPAVTFGTLQNNGNAIIQWKARIYLETNNLINPYPHYLGFRTLLVAAQYHNINNATGWPDANFDDFLQNPYNYLAIDKFPDRRSPCDFESHLAIKISSIPRRVVLIPSLKQVAIAINKICKNSDLFTPSMVRQLLGRDFPETEPATLSAQIQPHLRTLRKAGIIRIIQTSQRRNRPHELIIRDQLIQITLSDEYFIPLNIGDTSQLDDDSEESEDPSLVSTDDKTNATIDMERRLLELETKVNLLIEKINAIGTLLRAG